MLKLSFRESEEAIRFGYKEGEKIEYILVEYYEDEGTFVQIWNKKSKEWNWVSINYLKPFEED